MCALALEDTFTDNFKYLAYEESEDLLWLNDRLTYCIRPWIHR